MTPLVDAARVIATDAHAAQFYPPDHPPIRFLMHLGHAVSVLHRFSIEVPVVHAATWLHDVLEDTPMTAGGLQMKLAAALRYSAEDPEIVAVVDIVKAVTDEPGETRAERKARTYPKIVKAGTPAIFVKLADRIANVEASLLGGRGKDYLAIYKREQPGFKDALMSGRTVSLHEAVMWAYLDSLIAGERVP